MNTGIFKIAIFLLVFFLFCYFRFTNLDKRISFGWDQEQYTVQVRQLIKDHKPVLIGPRVNNDRGFFLAPYFTYIIAPFFLLTNLHPNALLYFLILFNFLFFFLSFYLIKSMFGGQTAFLFLIFWSINSLLATYDIIPWWPIWIPLGVIITWWLLHKIYHCRGYFWWAILGFTLGFFFNMHIQFALVIFFAAVFGLTIFKSKKISIYQPLISFIAFGATFIPLLIFDLRHQFLNSKLFINFFTNNGDSFRGYLLIWLPVFNNLIKSLIHFNSFILTTLFYVLIFALIIWLYRIGKGFYRNFFFSLAALWLVFPLVFTKYGRRPSEYYFIFLYPFLYLVVAESIKRLPKKIHATILIILIPYLFFNNLDSLSYRIKPDTYSLYYMDKLVKDFAPFAKNKKFNIAFGVPVGGDSGYRYLFDLYGIKQTENWSDPLVQLVRPVRKECQFKSEAGGIIVPKGLE